MASSCTGTSIVLVQDERDWRWINDIVAWHTFRLNCFLGGTPHKNWMEPCGAQEPEELSYLEDNYPASAGRLGQYQYDEENVQQIEEVIRSFRCTRRVFVEIREVILG